MCSAASRRATSRLTARRCCPRIGLPYAVQRLGHAFPVLRPARVMWPAFPSVPTLRSTGSATGRPALFVGFTANTVEFDFSCPFIAGYGSSPSRRGPARSRTARPDMRSPRFRRVPFVRHGVSDLGGAPAPRMAAPDMLPSTLLTVSASAASPFRGSIAHPSQSLCTLRRGRHLPRRNTRYQAGATPYLGRTCTGWNAPASPGAHVTKHSGSRPRCNDRRSGVADCACRGNGYGFRGVSLPSYHHLPRRRDQLHRMPERLQQACPMMARTAGFDRDYRRCELREERHHILAPESLAQNRHFVGTFDVSNSSGAAKLRKSFFDQGFTVFDRGNFGLEAAKVRPGLRRRGTTRFKPDVIAPADIDGLSFEALKALVVRADELWGCNR